MPKTSGDVRANQSCNILNFVKHENPVLHDLIEELCVGYLFSTRRRPAGITFLMPNDKTTQQLIKLLGQGDDEAVIAALRSLVLQSVLPSMDSFNNADVLVTFDNKKLPVEKVSGSVVELKGGAKVKASNFNPRTASGKHALMAVFEIDGLPDMSAAQEAAAPRKPPTIKRGAAELNVNRQVLVRNVMEVQFSANNAVDVSMQLLIRMHAKAKDDKNLCELIASQCSDDTFASLVVLLQPAKDNPNYISDEQLKQLLGNAADLGTMASNASVYVLCDNLAQKYKEIQDSCAAHAPAVAAAIEAQRDSIGRANAPKVLNSVAAAVAQALPACRKVSPTLVLAEAELRVMLALAQENNFDRNEIHDIVFNKCKLDKLYMCTDNMKNVNIAFYFSTAYLMVRSDAMYVPGLFANESDLDHIGDEDAIISLSNSMKKINAGKVVRAQNVCNVPRV